MSFIDQWIPQFHFFFFSSNASFFLFPENPEDSILDIARFVETMWFLYCTQPVRKLTLSYINHDKAFPFVIDDLFLLIWSGMLIAKTLNRLFADISVFSIWIVLVSSSVFCSLERSINTFSCFSIERGRQLMTHVSPLILPVHNSYNLSCGIKKKKKSFLIISFFNSIFFIIFNFLDLKKEKIYCKRCIPKKENMNCFS